MLAARVLAHKSPLVAHQLVELVHQHDHIRAAERRNLQESARLLTNLSQASLQAVGLRGALRELYEIRLQLRIERKIHFVQRSEKCELKRNRDRLVLELKSDQLLVRVN